MNDLTGKRFEKLVVIERNGSKNNKALWRCQCDCGNVKDVIGGNLQRGLTKSCGCLKKELFSKNTNNPKRHGMSGTRIHNEWRQMIARCKYKSQQNYKHYGGRGISVCKEWSDSFESFYEWAKENGYHDKLTLDRINVDGDYEPQNCRWITMQEQCRNRRMREGNKSGVNGVYYANDRNKWRAAIGVDYKHINLGTFDTMEEAINTRLEAEKKYFN